MPVHVDAEELRIFAAHLKRLSEVIGESMSRTQSQMGQLSETWQDPDFSQFRDSFSKTYPLLKEFIVEANKAVPSLLRDADIIDEYAGFKPD